MSMNDHANVANATLPPRPIQISLRGLLILTLAAGILIATWDSLDRWRILHFWSIATVLIASTYWAGRKLNSRIGRQERLLNYAAVGCVLFAILFAVAVWIRHRWLAIYSDDSWPRPWPYPDFLLRHYFEWIVSQDPVPPGMIKMCGNDDIETGRRHIDFVALGASSLFGLTLGYRCARKASSMWLCRFLFLLPT